MLYISHREQETRVLGPGLRYVLWLQGCQKRCPGCIFPEGQPLDKNGVYISVDELLCEIKSIAGIRGVTISGGEPFLQAEELCKLVQGIKRETDLDIMIYSGYTLAEIKNLNISARTILMNIDLLIDGEYIEKQNNNSAYRGSDNQVIYALSSKYRPYLERMKNAKNRSIEFVCRDDGDLFMIGIPAKGFREDFMEIL